jgi:threonine/homoserine/homoserine lactone efflux protein
MNPKAWMIALAALPTFTTPGQPILPQVAVIAVVFAAVSLPSLAAWAWMGREARRWLNSPRRLALFNRTMAALLVLSLLPLIRS